MAWPRYAMPAGSRAAEAAAAAAGTVAIAGMWRTLEAASGHTRCRRQ